MAPYEGVATRHGHIEVPPLLEIPSVPRRFSHSLRLASRLYLATVRRGIDVNHG